jgi:hypothetical protein
VLPSRKEKLRDKILKKSGLKRADQIAKKKKKPADDQKSISEVSRVSKETSNSVERRREEEAAKISVEFAMAQVFEQELKLHRLIYIVKQKIMKTSMDPDGMLFREV